MSVIPPPGKQILTLWMDFQAGVWPAGMDMWEVTTYLLKINEAALPAYSGTVITFTHFLQCADLMPSFVPPAHRIVYPVLGPHRLELPIRKIMPGIHVYGRSHVSRRIALDGTTYINNALDYPHERHIVAKQLMCIHQDG